ncbi:tetratricopeptide repeat protein [Neobacillus citreus]|uniref:Tetratricopeptide repeat protein n=1 Tax=Neobacillus citreus TaxID=2833578 RepID=A0A942T2F2_9BACI|nr:tetratricopeptide repeat protein [Neobacillus citreus]MCH6265011.1 tetratricopeptide repeat protein [Neobacillus citreus]
MLSELSKKKVFIGRKNYIDEFIDFIEINNENNPDISSTNLHFFGVGGIGKSSLRNQFLKILQEREEFIWSFIDFEILKMRDMIPFLNSLTANLLKQCDGLKFPLFNLAYEDYCNKTSQLSNLGKQVGVTFSDLADYGLGQFNQALPDINPVNALPKGLQFLTQGGKVVSEFFYRRKDKLHLSDLLKEMSYEEIEESLPLLWADDLKAYLEKYEFRTPVIILDTLEVHSENQDWLIKLISSLPQVNWVTFSRKPFPFNEAGMGKIIVVPFELENLSEDDCNKFFQQNHIMQPEIRSMIFQTTKGHPFYLELATETFHNIGNQRTPAVEDFEGDLQTTVDRFINYLSEESKELVEILSVPRSWTEDTFQFLLNKYLKKRRIRKQASDILRYSFITYNQNEGLYTMHDLMRRALRLRLEKEDPALLTDVHESLLIYFHQTLEDRMNKINPVTDLDSFLIKEICYHGIYLNKLSELVAIAQSLIFWSIELKLDPGEMKPISYLGNELLNKLDENTREQILIKIELITAINYELAFRGEFSKLDIFLQEHERLREKLQLAESSEDETGLFHYYMVKAYLNATREKFDEADEFHRKTFEASLPFYGIVLSVRVLVMLGLSDLARDVLDRVRPNFENEYEEYPLRKQLRTAQLLGEYSDTFVENEINYDEAIYYKTQALQIYENIIGPKRTPTILELRDLGDLYFKSGQLDAAIPIYERVLKLHLESEDKSTYQIARTLFDLGNAHWKKNTAADVRKAREYFEQGIKLLEEFEGELSINGLQLLALLHQGLGIYYMEIHEDKPARALRHLKKSLNVYEFGDNIKLINSYYHIGKIYTNNGEFEKGEEWLLKGIHSVVEIKVDGDQTMVYYTQSEEVISFLIFSLLFLNNTLTNREKFEEAEPILSLLLEISKNASKDYEYITPLVHRQLATIKNMMHQFGQSALYAKKTLAIIAEMDSQDNEKYRDYIIDSFINLAIANENLGEYTEAKKAYEELIQFLQSCYGPYHVETIMYIALAIEFFKAVKFKKDYNKYYQQFRKIKRSAPFLVNYDMLEKGGWHWAAELRNR